MCIPSFRLKHAERFHTHRTSNHESAYNYFFGSAQLRKVLLVEDDDLQLRIRAAILKSAGFEVISSLQAEDALSLITQVYNNGSRDSFSIVITDHLLPGMNGVEFVRKIRELDRQLPVVVLSGLPDAHLNYDGLNIIFRQKPCPPAEIIALVKHSFEHAA